MRNELWKRPEHRNGPPRFSVQERSIPLRPLRRKRGWDLQVGWKMAQPPPDSSITVQYQAGQCVARWPGNANMTHSKQGLCELARVCETVPMLVLFVHVCHEWEDRWYQKGHRGTQSKLTYSATKILWHKTNWSNPPEQLEWAQWVYARVVICSICSLSFLSKY